MKWNKDQLVFINNVSLNSYSTVWLVFFFLTAIGCAKNVTDLNVDDLRNALPEGVTLPSILENVTLPTVDDAKKLFKEKCNKVSGSECWYLILYLMCDYFIQWRLCNVCIFFHDYLGDAAYDEASVRYLLY